MIKIELTKDQQNLFKNMGMKVNSQRNYMYLPYWFVETETEGVFEILDPTDLPEDLTKHLQDLRK